MSAVGSYLSQFSPKIIGNEAWMFSVLRISIGSLYSIFNLYYVTLFLDVYRLDQWWFYVGQIVYFIWNSINDPIFGWLQDRMTSAAGGRNPRHTSITVAAPAYLIAFIYPFVPLFVQEGPNRNWTLGMHFIISLCFFDGMFTWIGLAHCAWFSDISSSTQKRARVTLLGELLAVLISVPVWLSYRSWNKEDLSPFRFFVCLLAVAMGCLFLFAARTLSATKSSDSAEDVPADQESELTKSNSDDALPKVSGEHQTEINIRMHAHHELQSRAEHKHEGEHSVPSEHAVPALLPFLKQLLSNRNFWAFVSVNFLQIYQLSFNSNYLPLFDAALFANQVPSWLRGLLVGAPDVVAPIMTVMLSPLAGDWGSHDVVSLMFWAKLAPAVLLSLVLMGSQFQLLASQATYLALFFCLSRCLTQATFSFFNMSVSDLIDEDMHKHRRVEPMSSMFFGVNALITKPAQSLAPTLTLYILSRAGYQQQSGEVDWSSNQFDSLRASMTAQVMLVPLFCTAAQLLIWKGCNSLTGTEVAKFRRTQEK